MPGNFPVNGTTAATLPEIPVSENVLKKALFPVFVSAENGRGKRRHLRVSGLLLLRQGGIFGKCLSLNP